MSQIDLLAFAKDQLHTFSVRYEGGECFFRAHYPARTRAGRHVQRYLEVCCDGAGRDNSWRYRSGYMYHEGTKFWSVPAEYVRICKGFAETVCTKAREKAKQELERIDSARCRAGFSIA